MADDKKTVVALGMFDGVHIGHKKLIDTAVLIAKARGLTPVVYTFSNHPQELLGNRVARLCSNEDRRGYLKALGVQYIDMVYFTAEICSSRPKDFVDMLISRLNPEVLVAGFNYTFGVKKSGTAEMLEKLANARGVDVAIINPVLVGKQPVSSTRIRELIEKGDVAKAQLMLGRTHNLSGTVVRGRGIGKQLSYPTANIKIDAPLVLPADGVYVTYLETDGSIFPAVTNVGNNPTVGGSEKGIETHILDFDGELYGRFVRVRFVKRLRGEKRFGSLDELRNQIATDVRDANHYFGKDV